MNWFSRQESKFGRFGIPDLILYVVVGRGLAYILALINPEYAYYLILYPEKVRHGEIWRIVTYIFTPPASAPFWAFLELYMTYVIGSALEAVWGNFRFTMYYLLGALGTAAASQFILGTPATPTFLNLSLFLAFATLFPDFSVMLFAILPIRAKYLGWIMGGYLTFRFWSEPLAVKVAIIVALANYLIFFWRRIREYATGKMRGTGIRVITPEPTPVHRCSVCRRTERDGADLEFRICACERCGEGREFCMEHLQEHLSASKD
jgi:membrane associated rhomboid family serine protease